MFFMIVINNPQRVVYRVHTIQGPRNVDSHAVAEEFILMPGSSGIISSNDAGSLRLRPHRHHRQTYRPRQSLYRYWELFGTYGMYTFLDRIKPPDSQAKSRGLKSALFLGAGGRNWWLTWYNWLSRRCRSVPHISIGFKAKGQHVFGASWYKSHCHKPRCILAVLMHTELRRIVFLVFTRSIRAEYVASIPIDSPSPHTSPLGGSRVTNALWKIDERGQHLLNDH
jgi:hypothetical protein